MWKCSVNYKADTEKFKSKSKGWGATSEIHQNLKDTINYNTTVI